MFQEASATSALNGLSLPPRKRSRSKRVPGRLLPLESILTLVFVRIRAGGDGVVGHVRLRVCDWDIGGGDGDAVWGWLILSTSGGPGETYLGETNVPLLMYPGHP